MSANPFRLGELPCKCEVHNSLYSFAVAVLGPCGCGTPGKKVLGTNQRSQFIEQNYQKRHKCMTLFLSRNLHGKQLTGY